MTNWTMLVALVLLAGMLISSALSQKDGLMKRPNPIELASDDAKEILLVMDTDKEGKISKEAWMKFMSAEFDRLDKTKTGTIDPKTLELDRAPVRVTRSNDLGK